MDGHVKAGLSRLDQITIKESIVGCCRSVARSVRSRVDKAEGERWKVEGALGAGA